jgi:hypothetical protein
VCPAKHLALQHFQPIDMPLDGARIPDQRHPGFDRRIVVAETFGKALQGLQRISGSALEPGIEALRLPLAEQGYVRDTREKVSQDVRGLKTMSCKFSLLCQLLLKSVVS